MASQKDLERVVDDDADSSTYVSETEVAERNRTKESVESYPGSDNDEAEVTDQGRLEELIREKTRESIQPVPRAKLKRIQSTTSQTSVTRRLSRAVTSLTTRNQRERIEMAKLPLSDLDKGIVGWDSQDDPEMPLNFVESRKWLLIGLISSITFISPLASSMFAPGVSFMDEEFHNSSVILSALSVSIFVLGFAVGPLILAPLSEIYGRRFVFTGANMVFCVWQIGCALAPNITTLIIFRFLAGVGGSGCLTIGGGVISDLFSPDQRGLATAVYSLGPLFGPVIGPITGGFVAQRLGWRWVFWILFIASTCVTAGIEIFNRETNPRVLIDRKVNRLRKELSRTDLRSCYGMDEAQHTPTRILLNGIVRPLKMLFCSPIVFLLSLYMAVVYGLLYLLFTTITGVFIKTYQWRPEMCGLAYIGLGLGFFAGLLVVSRTSDSTAVRMTKANHGVFEPEMRLPACIFFALFIPISFFWYGWSAEKAVHWIVPIIGLAPFGFGMMGIFIPVQTYVIDSFPTFAASGVAALTVSRSLFGAFLPLSAPSMYSALGLGWGNTVLGFVAIALIPAPLLIYKFGERIRKNHPIKL